MVARTPFSLPTLPTLPIDAVLPELLAALREHPCVVLRAPTGAGKTTRVPPALLDHVLGSSGQVIVTQPRRVAARAAARRMAQERGGEVGGEVGYAVRFDTRASAATRILVATEGVLVQRLENDPFLEGVGALVFDEIHERTLDADLGLAMARRVQREVRPDLKIVAMSATVDPGPLAEFLGKAAIVDSPGRLYPIEIRYLDAGDDLDLRVDPRSIAPRVAAAVERALREGDASSGVLVFLPGVGEILRTAERLESIATAHGCALFPLYGDLSPEQQDAALRPSSRRKVVLATNVAETSVTVEGISTVIDSGIARTLRYDAGVGLDRLELSRISRASADQRAGRAGRERPGLCLRLWPEWRHAALPDRELPEIARVDLAGSALRLLAWGERDLAAFDWLEAPDPAALERALSLLDRLGAIERGSVTALGREMVRLPTHPRLARLLIEGRERGVAPEAALLAALLGERDPFREGRGGGARRRLAATSSPSDLLDRLDALENFERSGGRRSDSDLGEISTAAARQVLAARDQLLQVVGVPKRGRVLPESERQEGILRALLAAYPDRVARRRELASPRAVMVGGRGLKLGDESAVQNAELFVAIDLDAGPASAPNESRVRLASAIERSWLAKDRLREEVAVELDPASERVLGRRTIYYEDLALEETSVPPPSARAAEVLAAAAAENLSRALPLDEPEVASFLARVRALARWMPDLGLPTFADDDLRALLPALAQGRRSFAELKRAPLLEALTGALSWREKQTLDREAPERIEVPSGSWITIQYRENEPPLLAVRIQEIFGWTETPKIAGGRVPLLLHLLAPNHRPQQVTHDLASFWKNTYPEVRKELAGRYPKHAWPVDPWTAKAERRPSRRNSLQGS